MEPGAQQFFRRMYPASMTNIDHVVTSNRWATMQQVGFSSYIFTGFIKEKWPNSVHFKTWLRCFILEGIFDCESPY